MKLVIHNKKLVRKVSQQKMQNSIAVTALTTLKKT